MSEREAKIILHIDNSPESRALQRICKKRGISFDTIYDCGSKEEVPAVETQLMQLRGWFNIKHYLLRPEECELLPDDFKDE